MRAPEFWRADGARARLLAPLGAIYAAVAQWRLQRPAPRAELPAIVVGGPTAGGDGKTPLAIALADWLSAQGERPALLTRGYGRRRGRSAPFVVDANADAAEVGDETPLLARAATTIVGADRAASAALAKELGASVLILDDGFHSRRLAGDVSLLVIDADYGAGNGRCLPAGPLRAPLDAQLALTDALVVIGDGTAGKALARRASMPAFEARVVADPRAASELAGARVVAFAGVGRPEKFFRTLKETGAEIVAAKSFPDHHRFSGRDIAELTDMRRRHEARLVTTEKDLSRLPADLRDVAALPIRLAVADMDGFAALLRAALGRARLSRVS